MATTSTSWPNLASMMFAQAERLGEAPWLWAKRDGVYRALSWAQAAADASALSRALRALGIGPGDRVALVSENRPEWAIADFAIMAAGAITVPAYTTNTASDHRHVLTSSGAKAVIVSTAALGARVAGALDAAPDVRTMIALEAPTAVLPGHVTLHSWTDALARGAGRPDDVRALAERWGRDDLACLIYTSGTGGAPKGVMLSHGALLHNCWGARRLFATIGLGRERFLSILPLSHAYEHTVGLMFPCSIGAEIYYAEGINELGRNFTEARPTAMLCVPRLYEVLRDRILSQVARTGGLKAKLLHLAVTLGSRRYRGRLGLVDRIADRALDRLVRANIAARFGGQLKAFISGGAPLNPEVGLFFVALGVRVLQGYGQTEAAPVVSVNLPERNRLETVGPPLEGVELRLAGDGEILVRSDSVMKGYWGDPEATALALRDGWLHTGDVGVIEPDGALRITDRKKDIIVVSGGDNVAPQKVEGVLAVEPEIAQVAVFGDKRPHLVALIVPPPELTKAHGGDGAALHRAVAKGIERANAKLSPIERVKRFAIAPEGFTIDNGLLTATLKIKRHAVLTRHRDLIEGLYG
ncbi:MAG: long-chain fatty acid--CoA ligase [Alphaproteobacteria bacterium]|nr:long-chain fatty acid--CoA ligase [Alphaproteobacteria bacterium]